jgi:hypothetical protein
VGGDSVADFVPQLPPAPLLAPRQLRSHFSLDPARAFCQTPAPFLTERLSTLGPTMNKLRNLFVVSAAALCGLCFLQGCGNSSSNTNAAASANSAASAAADPSTAPIISAVNDFLDAVVKGDSQRASSLLTPQAMQRIIASGLPFAPSGWANAKFKIGEVRSPSVGTAFVHCIVVEAAGTPSGQGGENCCWYMRQVGNDWRVSGVAYWADPNEVGTLNDFETGRSIPIPRDPAVSGSGTPSTAPAATTPGIPPRMAQDPATGAPR